MKSEATEIVVASASSRSLRVRFHGGSRGAARRVLPASAAPRRANPFNLAVVGQRQIPDAMQIAALRPFKCSQCAVLVRVDRRCLAWPSSRRDRGVVSNEECVVPLDGYAELWKQSRTDACRELCVWQCMHEVTWNVVKKAIIEPRTSPRDCFQQSAFDRPLAAATPVRYAASFPARARAAASPWATAALCG